MAQDARHDGDRAHRRPFDGYGRPGNQARAAAVLRQAGLDGALGGHTVRDAGDLDLPAGTPERGRETSLINQPALLVMTDVLGRRVADAVARHRFPLVYGGDCTTPLGSVPALRDLRGHTGLLFVDGHEDTMPLDVSEDGEPANAEIGLLLGLTGKLLTGPLAERLPALPPAALAVLGPRDNDWRRRFNVGSLRDSASGCGPAVRWPSTPPRRRGPPSATSPGAPTAGGCTSTSTCWTRRCSPPRACRGRGRAGRADLGAAHRPAHDGDRRGRSPRLERGDLRPRPGHGARRIVHLVRDVGAALPG
jgi:hypothetical protein